MNENDCYSFNDIMNSNFIDLSNKYFINIETNENLGSIWAKYGESSKINAIVNSGIIEFISKDGGSINKIYGINYNKDQKIFKYIKF